MDRRVSEREPPAGVRGAIDAAFERWGGVAARHPWHVIVAALALAAAAVLELPRLALDTSFEGVLETTDPVRVVYDRFRAQFGRDDLIVVGVEPATLFDAHTLTRLQRLHEGLERGVPRVRRVLSLVNARYTRGEDDGLIVEELLGRAPVTEAGVDEVRRLALANPLYRNQFLSSDGHFATMLIELERAVGTDAAARVGGSVGAGGRAIAGGAAVQAGGKTAPAAAVAAVAAVLQRHEAPGFRLSLTGAPVLEATLATALLRDVSLFVALSVAAIAAILFVAFRCVACVVLPLLVVALALLCTLGTMALAGVPFTPTMQVLPPFLLTVGVCDSVHILAVFRRQPTAGRAGPAPRNGGGRYPLSAPRAEVIARTLGHCGLPVVLTSATTAAGLLSFASAEIVHVASFGVFGPVGVGFALLFTIGLLPALLAVVPLGERADTADLRSVSTLDRWLPALGDAVARRPRVAILTWVPPVLLALAGVPRLRFSNDPLRWFPPEHPFRAATELVDRALGGSMSLEVMLDGGSDGAFHDPAALRRLEELERCAIDATYGAAPIGKALSLADVVKEIHQALNANQPAHYRLPESRRLVAQELLLFELAGSDDLEDFVDTRFRTTRLTLRLPHLDGMEAARLVERLEARFRSMLGDDMVLAMTGFSAVMARTFAALIRSMAGSYATAFVLIVPLMILLAGNVRDGLLGMLPNIIPVLLTLGLMGWCGFPVDMSTVMVGPIILGLVDDDTIHFLHGFGRHYRRSRDPRAAIRHTLSTDGPAMLFASVILAVGFGVYVLASMANVVYFGLLAAFAVVAAFVAEVLLTPALLVLGRKDRSDADDASDAARPRPAGSEASTTGAGCS
jgi:hypothetical protein